MIYWGSFSRYWGSLCGGTSTTWYSYVYICNIYIYICARSLPGVRLLLQWFLILLHTCPYSNLHASSYCCIGYMLVYCCCVSSEYSRCVLPCVLKNTLDVPCPQTLAAAVVCPHTTLNVSSSCLGWCCCVSSYCSTRFLILLYTQC